MRVAAGGLIQVSVGCVSGHMLAR